MAWFILPPGVIGLCGLLYAYKAIEISSDYVVVDEDEVFLLADALVTLPDISSISHPVTVHSDLFTATLASSSPINTSTTVSPGQARRLTPRSTGWHQI